MVPFRPTVDRTWEAIYSLHYDRRDERGYEVVMGPHLYADLLRGRPLWGIEHDPAPRLFGLPVEVDVSVPRGWIRLRHQVEA